MLGLPDSVAGCLFDLDGVLTQTAKIHAAAWKAMFDPYLRTRAAATDADYVPFDPMADYNQYVDGRPTYEGARAFLASRAIVRREPRAIRRTGKPSTGWATARTSCSSS